MPAENEQRRAKRPPLLCPVAPKETLLRKRLPPRAPLVCTGLPCSDRRTHGCFSRGPIQAEFQDRFRSGLRLL
jgi:hypothetical protein